MKNILTEISPLELLDIVGGDEHLWKGTDNDDTVEKFQARNAVRFAAALLLVASEIGNNKPVMTQSQAAWTFFDVLRYYNFELPDGHSGYSEFSLDFILNLWKNKFMVRNLGFLYDDKP